MKLLAKKEGSALIVVAFNLTEATLPVLDNLINQHQLQVFDYEPNADTRSIYGPQRVTVEPPATPFQQMASVKFATVDATPGQWAIWYNALALLFVNRQTLEIRSAWNKGLPYQDEIYALKLEEAQLITATEDPPESWEDAAPLLFVEAASQDVAITKVAKDVIDADKAHKDRLIRSENMRTQFNLRSYQVSTREDLVKFRNDFAAQAQAN